MDQKCDRLYLSAPLEKNDLKQRLEKKLNDVNSFNKSNINIEEMITYFEDKNNQSEKKFLKYKFFTRLIKSFDTFVYIVTTSRSITLILMGIGLIAIPVSTGIACGVTISNNVLFEIVVQKQNKYTKLYERV